MTEARRESMFTRLWRRSPPPEPIADDLPPWRLEPEPPPTVRGRRNRVRRFGVLGLFLSLIGVLLVQVCLWFAPPRPADLILVGAGYEENLAVPANVAGKRALHELADWARPEPGRGLAAWFRRARRLRLRAEPIELYVGG